MPRLINHSKFIVSWICHCKSKILCVAAKPRECWSMFKFFRKRSVIRSLRLLTWTGGLDLGGARDLIELESLDTDDPLRFCAIAGRALGVVSTA